jgi:hypothetical protein
VDEEMMLEFEDNDNDLEEARIEELDMQDLNRK